MIGQNLMLTLWFWISFVSFIVAIIILWKWYRPEDMMQEQNTNTNGQR